MCRNIETRVAPFPSPWQVAAIVIDISSFAVKTMSSELWDAFYAKISANPVGCLSESQDYGQHSVARSSPLIHRLLLLQVPEHQAASRFPCMHDDGWRWKRQKAPRTRTASVCEALWTSQSTPPGPGCRRVSSRTSKEGQDLWNILAAP